MVTELFKLNLAQDGWEMLVEVTQHKYNDDVFFKVLILEPDDFAFYNELEQPLTMVYNADLDSYKFRSAQDLSYFDELGDIISKRIINRHL